MEAVGRGEGADVAISSRIPEMEILAGAFSRMQRTLREYQAQLREAEQVRGAQETARFVAHEIRNALTPVRAGLAVLERRVAELPEATRPQGERALQGIRAEAARMASLASAFSEYAHLPEPRPTSLDPAALVRELAEREIPPGITGAVRVHEPLPRILADRDEIERMLRNLIKNAVEAMEGTGSLTISARSADDAATVEMEVIDNGPGMDARTLAQVWQPGFTTKAEGTGLGLALVRGTVIRMGGRLGIESRPGAGTRVTIRLPAERPGAGPLLPPEGAPAGGRERQGKETRA
jgi:signal transduction histidine kinase